MRKFKFIGHEEPTAGIRDGNFTLGKVYSTNHVQEYVAWEDDALFRDDDGDEVWEDINLFEEVTND